MRKIKILTYIVFGIAFLFSCYRGKGGLHPDLKKCIGNPKHAAPDGRLIIGFTTQKSDGPHTRRMPGLVAIYEGDSIPEIFYDH